MSVVAALLVLISAVLSADEVVKVHQQPPTVERIPFDRNSPPAGMPKLERDEAALCQFDFGCRVQLDYEIISSTPVSQGVSVEVRITNIEVTLNLSNKVFLPMNAAARLRAHEEGHKECNEKCYVGADKIARAIAEDVASQTWRATAETSTAAGKLATDPAVRQISDRYVEQVAGRASRIGDIYDDLTDHGRNAYPVAKAIERSFQRFEKERSTTRPAR